MKKIEQGKRKELSDAFVDGIMKPGKYYDRNRLFLKVKPNGRKNWEQRVRVGVMTRTLGLGSYPTVTLRMAREKAIEHLRMAEMGLDPFVEKRRMRTPTFAEAAAIVITERAPSWSDPRQEQAWTSSLSRHAFPKLGRMLVSDIESITVRGVLMPIWHTKSETAYRVLHRIRAIMAWAKTNGFRTDKDNPADQDFASTLPAHQRTKRRHPSLPYAEVYEAIIRVRESDAFETTKDLFEFTVLTAARSGEARGAVWGEIDFEDETWTVPEDRIKMRVEHCVPLSSRALEILRKRYVEGTGHGLIFPSPTGREYSDVTVTKLLRELGIRAVLHGFRASFRTWCADTRVEWEVAETCLAHALGKVASRYINTEIVEIRREVLEDWARYVGKPPVPIDRPRKRSSSGGPSRPALSEPKPVRDPDASRDD